MAKTFEPKVKKTRAVQFLARAQTVEQIDRVAETLRGNRAMVVELAVDTVVTHILNGTASVVNGKVVFSNAA